MEGSGKWLQVAASGCWEPPVEGTGEISTVFGGRHRRILNSLRWKGLASGCKWLGVAALSKWVQVAAPSLRLGIPTGSCFNALNSNTFLMLCFWLSLVTSRRLFLDFLLRFPKRFRCCAFNFRLEHPGTPLTPTRSFRCYARSFVLGLTARS